MGNFIGWVNVILLISMTSIFFVKEMIKKDKSKIDLYKKIRVIHPIVGCLIIVLAIIHAYIQFGGFSYLRINSGLFIILTVVLMAIIAFLGKKKILSAKRWRLYHKIFIIPLAIFVCIHILKIF